MCVLVGYVCTFTVEADGFLHASEQARSLAEYRTLRKAAVASMFRHSFAPPSCMFVITEFT